MTIKRLKMVLATLDESWDDLDVAVRDPNDGSLYSVSGNVRKTFCDIGGYECEEDGDEAEEVAAL